MGLKIKEKCKFQTRKVQYSTQKPIQNNSTRRKLLGVRSLKGGITTDFLWDTIFIWFFHVPLVCNYIKDNKCS